MQNAFCMRWLPNGQPDSCPRGRSHSQRVIESWGTGKVTRLLLEKYGDHVLDGPFAGIHLTSMTQAEQLGPYLLGLYECELDEAWKIVFRGAYTQIIDIGAKFGYYAVGLAKRFPAAEVVAFDTDWWARKAMREMIAANDTPKVRVEGFCDAQWLISHLREDAFIISDCEGYEGALFTDAAVSRMAASTLIIETHDCIVPGVSERLESIFRKTHEVRIIPDGANRREPVVPLDMLTDAQRPLAVREVRPPQCWLLCLPQTGSNRILSQAD